MSKDRMPEGRMVKTFPEGREEWKQNQDDD
jgi:hypothetical protein